MSTSSIVDRLTSLLESTPPLLALPAEERSAILSDVSLQFYGPGDVIIAQGTMTHPGLYIVESGVVRLMDVVQMHLLDKVGEGETFGSFGLIKGGATIYEAKAIEPTVCALLKGETFQRLYSRYPEFAVHFDQDLRKYVRRMGVTMDVTGEHLLFSRSLSQFIHRRLVTCEPDLSARSAAQLMKREGVESLLVMQSKQLVGIVTDGDLRNEIVARGLSADTPVRKIMKQPVVTMSAEASIYEAMMTMLSKGVHRLVLVDGRAGDHVVGVLTDRDVGHFRGQDPVATASRIDNASSVEELANIRVRTSEQLLNLFRQGARPEMLNRFMMVFYDRLAVRVLRLVEAELRSTDGGAPAKLPWAWVRLGSGGRQEMSLNSEQHNALIYADPESPEMAAHAERWFNRLAEGVNEALDQCGFSPSEFVARDARWRRPLRAWKHAYREWILQSDERTLASTPIFFDLRAIYGDGALVEELKDDVVDALNVQAMDESRTFLKLLAVHAMEYRPPTGFLRKMFDRVGEGRHVFDVRDGGIRPIVDAARVLALEIRYLESPNTFERLRRVAADVPDMSDVIEGALEAYQYLVDFRLESQLRAVEVGDPPVNQIDASALNRMQQRLVRDAFSRAAELQDALARRYGVRRKRSGRESGDR